MTINNTQSLFIILVIAGVTFLTRVTPFLIFNGKKETPDYVKFLGKVLPYSLIGMLIVYCLKSVSLFNYSHGLPEGLAILAIILIHLWKKNTLLSIALGTVLYMFLVQVVFV